MFLNTGIMILSTVFATDPLVDEFFAQSHAFVLTDDLNDYSHVFSDDEAPPSAPAVDPIPASSELVNSRSRAYYSERHMEIIKELSNGRLIRKDRAKLFLEAEDRFKAENLISMNESTFSRYLTAFTHKKKNCGDSSRGNSYSRRGQPNLYTAAHDAIVQEVVRRCIEERRLSRINAFREVSERFRAENLEPITRHTFKYWFNSFVVKEKNMFSELRA